MKHLIFSIILYIFIGEHLCSAQSKISYPWNHVPVEKNPQRDFSERAAVPYKAVVDPGSSEGYYNTPKAASPQYAYYEAQLYPEQGAQDQRVLAYQISEEAYKNPQYYQRNEYLESVTPNPNQIQEPYSQPENHWNVRPTEFTPIVPHGNGENLDQYHVEVTSPQHLRPAQPQKAYQSVPSHYNARPKYVKPRVQAYQDPLQKQFEAEDVARAQAQAQEDALKFQKISSAAHLQHQQAALHQFKIDSDRYRLQLQQQDQEQLQREQNQQREYDQHQYELEQQQYQQQQPQYQQPQPQPQPQHQPQAHPQPILQPQPHQQYHLNLQQHQPSALEQIQEGYVSKAGHEHVVKEYQSRDPGAYHKPSLRAQATAKLAEARKAQEVAEHKAHSDAIINLQRTQQAHLKAQEDAEIYALNFEKNQIKAQALAQKIANAQAKSLYAAYQAARAKARKEISVAAQVQLEARKRDPNAPVVQYLLENNSQQSH